ncbi:glycoside hydrolase family 43 protein [Catenovulum maritimum]|uniref:Beta-xylosidase n=1 Tax=Catenovulum maritimum TaxID=1513271 RepID=A0A0J8GMX9_9ALTE|nr:glycoside hydrolase family 43 protein [Catenovulum maritimum]KMT64140.1 beta-xylosidase [Catenovulum maritimum]
MLSNPILRGFNPDPSIICVDENYYIATSTFEWFPGVQIHHSTDLVNWHLITHPLNNNQLLDLKGIPDSCGVWAPCLSYSNGIYYLVYTIVKSFDGPWKDLTNYLITASDITGPWSSPIKLNHSGFDPSLFHDDDKKWLVNMKVDHRNNKLFGGIVLQEYCPERQSLIGDEVLITKGSELGLSEGPHLYKRGEFYYLILAEGGTSYDHAVSIARSKSLTGPYEFHPNNPILTAKANTENLLQKTGHADICQGADGNWYMVFLTSRPVGENRRCVLGRETAIEQVYWGDDAWLHLKSNNKLAREVIPQIGTVETKYQPIDWCDNFDNQNLDINLSSLRQPITSQWADLKARDNWLRLYGRDSLASTFEQSLLARRVQNHEFFAQTKIDFTPTCYQQSAGLVCYYNTTHWHYLAIQGREDGKRELVCLTYNNRVLTQYPTQAIELPDNVFVYLRCEVVGTELVYAYSLDAVDWINMPHVLNMSILSDDYVCSNSNAYKAAFTGAFIGICCQDLSHSNHYADFEYFSYTELNQNLLASKTSC